MKHLPNPRHHMPKYRYKKCVYAHQISKIEHHEQGYLVTPVEAGYQPFLVSQEYVRDYKPHPNGFYVIDEDGKADYLNEQEFKESYSLYETKQKDPNEKNKEKCAYYRKCINEALRYPLKWKEHLKNAYNDEKYREFQKCPHVDNYISEDYHVKMHYYKHLIDMALKHPDKWKDFLRQSRDECEYKKHKENV